MPNVTALLLGLALLAATGATIAQNSVGAKVDDAGITAKVKTALIADRDIKANQINVETSSGVVQLSGFVDSETMKGAAEATAESVTGVRNVQNKLMIRAGGRSSGAVVDDTVIAAKVKSGIAGKSGLSTASNVNVEVNKGVVELSGFVATADQKNEATLIARSVAGVVDVKNSIELRPRG